MSYNKAEMDWGIKAIGTARKWKGIVNQSNGAPTLLGKEFWYSVKSDKKKIIDKIKDANDISKKGINRGWTSESDPDVYEWVYVFNPDTGKISVLRNQNLLYRKTKSNGLYTKKYITVDTYKLDEAEPNWEKVQELGWAIDKLAYDNFKLSMNIKNKA